MANKKIVSFPDIGEVTLVKQRKSKHLRISISSDRKIRISMPFWTPYAVAIEFAINRKDWIISRLESIPKNPLFIDGQQIGKAHRLMFKNEASSIKISTRILGNKIMIILPLNQQFNSTDAQLKTRQTINKALKKEADNLLPQRLKDLAQTHNYTFNNLRIKRLKTRWGSCSSKKEITLNFCLMTLPWNLIDYVLLHELNHTKHMHHKKDFWDALTQKLPDCKKLRKELKDHHAIL